MKDLSEKLNALNDAAPFTEKEMGVYYQKLNAIGNKMAKEHSLDSYFPIQFINELGELITVLSEWMGRPDKEVDPVQILDELADVYGMCRQAMLYFGFSKEALYKTIGLKLVNGMSVLDPSFPEELRNTYGEGCFYGVHWDQYNTALRSSNQLPKSNIQDVIYNKEEKEPGPVKEIVKPHCYRVIRDYDGILLCHIWVREMFPYRWQYDIHYWNGKTRSANIDYYADEPDPKMVATHILKDNNLDHIYLMEIEGEGVPAPPVFQKEKKETPKPNHDIPKGNLYRFLRSDTGRLGGYLLLEKENIAKHRYTLFSAACDQIEQTTAFYHNKKQPEEDVASSVLFISTSILAPDGIKEPPKWEVERLSEDAKENFFHIANVYKSGSSEEEPLKEETKNNSFDITTYLEEMDLTNTMGYGIKPSANSLIDYVLLRQVGEDEWDCIHMYSLEKLPSLCPIIRIKAKDEEQVLCFLMQKLHGICWDYVKDGGFLPAEATERLIGHVQRICKKSKEFLPNNNKPDYGFIVDKNVCQPNYIILRKTKTGWAVTIRSKKNAISDIGYYENDVSPEKMFRQILQEHFIIRNNEDIETVIKQHCRRMSGAEVFALMTDNAPTIEKYEASYCYHPKKKKTRKK